MGLYSEYTGTNDFPEKRDIPLVDAKRGWPVSEQQATPADLALRIEKYAQAITDWMDKYKIPQSVRDEWNAAQLKGEEPTSFWKRMKAKVTTTVNAVKDDAKIASLLLLFMPMVPLAVLFLKRKGVTPATTPKALLMQVYNEMSKNNFGLTSSSKDAFDYVSVKKSGFFAEFGLTESEAASLITPDQIELVLKFLRTILDTIKRKKETGAPLSPEETAAASLIPTIDAEYKEATEAAINGTETKILGMSWKTALAVLILVILGLYFYFKK